MLSEEALIVFNYVLREWLGATDELFRYFKEDAENHNMSIDDYLISLGARWALSDA